MALVENDLHRPAAHGGDGLMNGGQFRGDQTGQVNIIEAHQLNLVRHRNIPLVENLINRNGHHVVAGNDTVHLGEPFQQFFRHGQPRFKIVVALHNLLRQTVLPAVVPVALIAGLGRIEPLNAADADQIPAAAGRQMFRRQSPALVVVAVEVGVDVLRLEQGVQHHHRHMVLGQFLLERLVIGRHDDTVGVGRRQHLQRRPLLVQIVVDIIQNDAVSPFFGRLVDDVGQLGKVGIANAGNDDADGLAGFFEQGPGHFIGDKAHLLNGPQHPFPLVGSHRRGAVNHPGDRGGRHAGPAGHIPYSGHTITSAWGTGFC